MYSPTDLMSYVIHQSPNNADILIIIDRLASSFTRLDKHIQFNLDFMLIGNKFCIRN